MAPLTILTDDEVRKLLHTFTQNDIINLQSVMAEALHTYSTGTQDESACAANQPLRTSITLKNGATTLFMPSKGANSTGMKIVTLSEGDSTNTPSTPSLKSTPSVESRASSTSVHSTTSSAHSSGTMDTSSLASALTRPSTTPQGSLTLLDGEGAPVGLMNAAELTAFRTALVSTMLLKRREHVSTITVFGAGKQAYWHIRLALLLRGADIKRVNIVNRTFARAQPLLEAFYGVNADGIKESDATAPWRAFGTKFTVLSTEYGEYERLLKEEVRKADVIFCCTPSAAPLFPAEHLTATEGRKKGRYVTAIGSYKRHMCELHPDILRQAASPPHHSHHHYHKHARSEGVIIVDSLTACLEEAGEVIQAGLGPEQLVELGELVMLKRQHEARLASSPSPSTSASSASLGPAGSGSSTSASTGTSRSSVDQQEDDQGLREWLSKGNVIYKS
ncbi:MAG: hypothetical protein M1838_004132, partial [Thelocarpon superellum]